MYRVQMTEQAQRDLQEAASYIQMTLHNSAAALHLLDEAEQQLNSLSDFPERNPLVKDAFLAAGGIRVQMVKQYLAVYTINESAKTVVIIRILHSRRNWMAVLKSED